MSKKAPVKQRAYGEKAKAEAKATPASIQEASLSFYYRRFRLLFYFILFFRYSQADVETDVDGSQYEAIRF